MEFWPAPTDADDFESLCLDLFQEIWGPQSGAQKNARRGQPQAGVDVYGRVNGQWIGVQCKEKDALVRSRLALAELEAEVEKALGPPPGVLRVAGEKPPFNPALSAFFVATTEANDGPLQERAREITDERGIPVEVWSWTRLWHEISRRPQLLARIGRIYWRQLFELLSAEQKIAPTQLTHVAAELFGREKEFVALDAAWADDRVKVVTLVAWGGVGKTSLVAKWAARLAERNYDEASYFDWSFYSQGTQETGSATGEPFVNAALRFFGGEKGEALASSAKSGWEKGSKLAQFVAKRRALLILDGLEPLQYPPSSPLAGQLKDPGVEALLKGLAARNAGLCVVTTREKLAEQLNAFRGTSFLEWPLERLSTAAGVALLEKLQVKGSRAELEGLVDEVAGHALTLQLLGSYLWVAHGGDVRKRGLVKFEDADRLEQGGHAFRVIAAFVRWLQPRPSVLERISWWFVGKREERLEGERQLSVLRLMGLFDRPADRGCLAALRREPAIEGLTEPLVGLSPAQWELTVTRLADRGLLARAPEGGLDAHPLIREFFAKRLRESQLTAWRSAHGRLFEHLRDSTETFPASLDGLQPLYQAVPHGCHAGLQQQACDEVYKGRICRGQEYFATKKLGAIGADLGAVACFFDSPWSRVSPSLTEATQAWLLNQAAFGLRTLSRLTEAVEPFRAALDIVNARQDWEDAAMCSSNLSELELTLGDLFAAMQDAERSVAYADRCEGVFLRMAFRTNRADALHQVGRCAEALEWFREAERLQAEERPKSPWLYSLGGFRYNDLLLGEAERAAGRSEGGGGGGVVGALLRDVEERAKEALVSAERNRQLLSIGLDRLTLGRVALYRAILEGGDLARARAEIEQAVDGLRFAGTLDHLPKGLLTRAWLRAKEGDEAAARADLAEAEDIATRGPMPLYLADIHLYRGRLFKDREALAESRRLIEKHGYLRRLGELEDAERSLST